MSTTLKRSRFYVEPTGKPFQITGNDVNLLDLFQSCKYLPTTYIAALSGVSLQYTQKRLTVLRHEAGLIDCPPESWGAANARYRPAVYQLTDKGRKVLKEKGRERK